jgi:hypothetical protein
MIIFFVRIVSYAKKYALQAEGNKVKLSDLCHLMPISSITNHVALALTHLQQCNRV